MLKETCKVIVLEDYEFFESILRNTTYSTHSPGIG